MKADATLRVLNADEVLTYLSTQTDILTNRDGTRAYEEAIVRLIDQNDWSKQSAATILTSLIATAEENTAFAAFYALCTFYRRHDFKSELRETLVQYASRFSARPSYAFIHLMSRKMSDPNDWSILEDANRLCDPEILGYNYGVEHCFAEYVAEACEKDPSRAAYYVSEHLDAALERVADALKQSCGYPKFYVTRARLQTLKAIYRDGVEKEAIFHQALNDIELAVSREEDNQKKINYRLVGLQLQSSYYERVLAQSISRQEEQVNEKLQEGNVKNLEFLSFFSAIIGLLLAGTQLLLGLTFAQGAALIVVLTGCLITAFGTIGFVLHEKKRFKINLLIVAIGLALAVFGMIYGGIYAL